MVDKTHAAPATAPNLMVTDIWLEGGSNICAQIINNGDAEAAAGHTAELFIDDINSDSHLVNATLDPKERLDICYSYKWGCSDPSDSLRVNADYYDVLDESNEIDNSRLETFTCDQWAPEITSGPIATDVLSTTATIVWSTSEDSDSTVEYDVLLETFEHFNASDELVTDHSVSLSNLQPGAVYQYRVRSADEAGNSIESKPAYFETLPVEDSEAPEVNSAWADRSVSSSVFYTINAPVTDNHSVARVEFYLDDVLFGVDFTGGDSGAGTGVFQAGLAPGLVGMNTSDFFSPHTITTLAFDASGLPAASFTSFSPPPDPFRGNVEIQRPAPEYLVYIPGSTVPSGTTVPVRVQAERLEENCAPASLIDPITRQPIACEPYPVDVDRLVVTVHRTGGLTTTLCDLTPDSLTVTTIFNCTWHPEGQPVGMYSIEATAYGPGGTQLSDSRLVEVLTGAPRLEAAREVARIGNAYRVRINLHNAGTMAARVGQIADAMTGFQPVRSTSGSFLVSGLYCPLAYANQAVITPQFGGKNTFDLAPGGSQTVEYFAEPVLYPDPGYSTYNFGQVSVTYTYMDASQTQNFNLSRSSTDGGEAFSAGVRTAQQGADYLILTQPQALFNLNPDQAKVNEVLSAMAELAYLKNGILGYVNTGWAPTVDALVNRWGAEMRGGDGVSRHWRSNGYLLLVGEAEVLGSFGVYYQQKNFWGTVTHSLSVQYSDNGYADTDNDSVNPEVIVGRIPGDTAADLLIPIDNAIQIARGTPGIRLRSIGRSTARRTRRRQRRIREQPVHGERFCGR